MNHFTPWTASKDLQGGEPFLWTVHDTRGGIVFFGMEESVAKLFAAAPEMLAALQYSHHALLGTRGFQSVLVAVDEAITKAVGVQP